MVVVEDRAVVTSRGLENVIGHGLDVREFGRFLMLAEFVEIGNGVHVGSPQ